MSPKPDDQFGKRFLTEALPLVSSYLSGEKVKLANEHVLTGEESDDESILFAEQLRLRYAISFSSSLLPIIHQIEERVSTLNEVIRTEARGIIRGRLDVSRYVSQKAMSNSWPKKYPIYLSQETPSTPENQLISRIFRFLISHLSVAKLPADSAEATSAKWYRNWYQSRLKRDPWLGVSGTSSLQRLCLETSRRVARRQTGNDRAYADLVSLVNDWQVTNENLGAASSSGKFVDRVLAFPADDSFADRVFEIWCLREIATALESIGGKLASGPFPLTESRNIPIYSFQFGKNKIDLWFQKSLPPDHAVWRYQSNNQKLRGIPDISVIANGRHFLLIDAKNRLVRTRTRSEETYKMLGYFDNFRPLLSGTSCWGILVFTSLNGFHRSLISDSGGKVIMLSADPVSAGNCTFIPQFSGALNEWISQWQK